MRSRRAVSILLISLATVISRILGLVREQLFAFLLGATNFADAFFVAFRIPNMLRDLFAEGSLSTAFIPVFTDYLIRKDRKRAFRLANYVINFLLLAVGGLTLLGYLYTPSIVKFIAPGFVPDPAKFQITVVMTQILMPFLLVISLAAIFMGILNTRGRFFLPALAPAIFNVVIIITGVLILIFDPRDMDKAVLWSVGSLLGGIVQFFIQVPYARKEGYRYEPCMDWKFAEPGLRRILKLMLPSVIGLAAMQINVVVNTNLASLLEAGTVSCLNYSFRLLQLPIGIFGVAISTVSTALIAKDVARRDRESLKDNIAFSLKLNSFVSVPSMILLMVLGLPAVRLLFQHGRFTGRDSLLTYYSLLYYAPSLFFFSGIKIFAPVFYAIKKVSIPVIATFLAVGVNLLVSVGTFRSMGIRGLSLGLTCGMTANFLFLMLMFFRYYGSLKRKVVSSILKHSLAGLFMAGAGYAVYRLFLSFPFFPALLFPLLAAGAVYLLFCLILKARELLDFIRIFKKRLKRTG